MSQLAPEYEAIKQISPETLFNKITRQPQNGTAYEVFPTEFNEKIIKSRNDTRLMQRSTQSTGL